jgi:hypothetical protein
MRHLNWYMGHLAYEMIKVKKVEKTEDKDP